jgi:hypothetical protein
LPRRNFILLGWVCLLALGLCSHRAGLARDWFAVFEQPCEGTEVCAFHFAVLHREAVSLRDFSCLANEDLTALTISAKSVPAEGCGPFRLDVTDIVPEVSLADTTPPILAVWSVNCDGIPSECFEWIPLDPSLQCGGISRKNRDGDANSDGIVDISDAVYVIKYLFGGERRPCFNAADVNNDGQLDVSDAIQLLSKLFGPGRALLAP